MYQLSCFQTYLACYLRIYPMQYVFIGLVVEDAMVVKIYGCKGLPEPHVGMSWACDCTGSRKSC